MATGHGLYFTLTLSGMLEAAAGEGSPFVSHCPLEEG